MNDVARIRDAGVAAYTIPTDRPESDGTLEWRATTLVVVTLRAGGAEGLGYTYADSATALLIRERLLPLVEGCDALDGPMIGQALLRAIRNLGRPGIASMALSAVDNALWDLKGKLLDASVADLLGRARPAIAVYGSGGFTSDPVDALKSQLGGWTEQGLRFVKMKVGREPAADVPRVKAARAAIGPDNALFVDANGAYTAKQALAFAQSFAEENVSWFEEPVSSDDLAGLRAVRRRAPAGMDVAAGEYGYEPLYFRRMLEAQAVDVLQADATRCGGISGFMAAAALADGYGVPLSSHCAPSLHIAPCCAAARAVHLEYFHDHVRIERMLFDGFREPRDGFLSPERSRPGLGIELKRADAERFRC
jgi:L-alanine-DL-glutamate epimerase-like enolase superfamily enzyme